MEAPISKARLRYLMPVELIKFLKKERALCAFINNMLKYNGCINHLKDKGAILHAFRWETTPETLTKGYKFWVNINIKWVNKCDSKSKN